jgi:mono/diheme cytochrome c family protein
MITRRVFATTLLLAAAACGGGDGASSDAGAAPAPPQQAALSFDPARITPAQIALGDSIFHGKVGASSCQACHGAGGNQGTVAPVLTDAEWLHSDGSLEGIFRTIKSGVMTPKKFSSVMPPYGGVMLTDDRTLAVAAYVYSISHPK